MFFFLLLKREILRINIQYPIIIRHNAGSVTIAIISLAMFSFQFDEKKTSKSEIFE